MDEIVYAASPHWIRHLGNGQYVYADPVRPEPVCLSRADMAILERCRRGLSDIELAALLTSNDACQGVRAGQRVEQLLRAGLLRRRRLIPTTGHPKFPMALATVTRNRPTTLRRWLSSCAGHLDHFGYGSTPLLVFDCSDDGSCASIGRDPEVLLSRGRVRLFDSSFTEALVSALKGRGVEERLLRFAVTGPGPGSGRNLAILLTGDRPILMADDDILFDTWTSPSPESAVELACSSDTRDIRFFDCRAQALESVRREQCDLLRGHSEFLGATALPLSAVKSLVASHACADLLSFVTGETPGEIVTTFTGIAGDSGIGCPYEGLAGLFGAYPDEAPSDGAMALRSREVTQIARRPIVSHSRPYRSYCIGLSGSGALPPFLPSGRNQDGLHGYTLRSVSASSLSVHIPVGVVHDSPRPSRYPDPTASARSTRLADVLIGLTARWRASGCHADRMTLDSLGLYLERISQLTPTSFVELLHQLFVDRRAEVLRCLATIADRPGTSSASWRRAHDAYRLAFVDALRSTDSCIPSEVQGASFLDRVDRTRAYIQLMGQLYGAWPSIRAAADSHRVV